MNSSSTHLKEFIDNNHFSEELLNEHGLSGWVNKSKYKTNLHLNIIYIEEYNKLDQLFKKNLIENMPIKGIFLLKDLYTDWGFRPLSDIDLIFHSKDSKRVHNLLNAEGYTHIDEPKWYGNHFKSIYRKEIYNIEITIELHFGFFWHSPQIICLQDLLPKNKHYIENHFLLLIGHLSLQHNFLKLFWLADIFLYARKHQNSMNWKYIVIKAKESGLNKSLAAVTYSIRSLIDINFNNNIDLSLSKPIKWSLNQNFLIQPRKHVFRYVLLKHLIKDNLMHSLKYDFYWILEKFSTFTRIFTKYKTKFG